MADATKTGFKIRLDPPDDDNVRRDRIGRFTSCVITALFMTGGPMVLLGIIGSIFGFWFWALGLIIGFYVGGRLFIHYAWPRIVIYNEEWSGFVTQDPASSSMVIYGPGFHLAHFWEQRNSKHNYSLKVITQTIEVEVQTTSAKVIAIVKFQYVNDLRRLDRAIGANVITVNDGYRGYFGSFLTQELSQCDAEAARTRDKQLNEELAAEFMSIEHEGENIDEFQGKYGLLTVSAIVSGIKLPPAVEKTRDAIDEAKQLYEVVAELHGMTKEELKARVADGSITHDQYKEMLNRALVVSDNDATLTISAVEGTAAALAGKAMVGLANSK